MEKQTLKRIKQFAWISLAEGISFLVLLLIAMPLKYFADLPLFVKYFGWAHGVLFILYVVLLAFLGFKLKWGILRMAVYFIAAFLPLAPFLVERKVQREYVLK